MTGWKVSLPLAEEQFPILYHLQPQRQVEQSMLHGVLRHDTGLHRQCLLLRLSLQVHAEDYRCESAADWASQLRHTA